MNGSTTTSAGARRRSRERGAYGRAGSAGAHSGASSPSGSGGTRMSRSPGRTLTGTGTDDQSPNRRPTTSSERSTFPMGVAYSSCTCRRSPTPGAPRRCACAERRLPLHARAAAYAKNSSPRETRGRKRPSSSPVAKNRTCPPSGSPSGNGRPRPRSREEVRPHDQERDGARLRNRVLRPSQSPRAPGMPRQTPARPVTSAASTEARSPDCAFRSASAHSSQMRSGAGG